MLRGLLVFIALLWGYSLLAQKTLTAVKTQQSPVIDGKLDDAAWNSAPLATDFIQSFPSFGGSALTKTEVRILYDNSAVYVGAHMYDDPLAVLVWVDRIPIRIFVGSPGKT